LELSQGFEKSQKGSFSSRKIGTKMDVSVSNIPLDAEYYVIVGTTENKKDLSKLPSWTCIHLLWTMHFLCFGVMFVLHQS
jgi:hypothetical protein